MDLKISITFIITTSIALIGFFLKYLHDIRLNERKDHLDRVNRQLRDLYGPLYSLQLTGISVWEAFVEKYTSHEGFMNDKGFYPVSDEAKAIWRHWIKTVFMPNNAKFVEILTHNSDLIDNNDIPTEMTRVFAHVHGYKAIIASWDEGDFSEHLSLVGYPTNAIYEHVSFKYQYLKKVQEELLGRNLIRQKQKEDDFRRLKLDKAKLHNDLVEKVDYLSDSIKSGIKVSSSPISR